jgi:hypothetical protein
MNSLIKERLPSMIAKLYVQCAESSKQQWSVLPNLGGVAYVR